MLEDFVREFFDQNPISQVWYYVYTLINFNAAFLQLGVISTKDGKAEKLLDLNGIFLVIQDFKFWKFLQGNSHVLAKVLSSNWSASGELSLQNALSLAMNGLK